MKAKAALIAFLLFLFCFSFAKSAFVATQSLSANNIPLTVDQSQEFSVDIAFSCPSCSSDSYLRGVFYPSGTSYFGYTQDNNGNWSNAAGGSCTTYYKVGQMDLSKEGTWSGTLKIKPDKDSTYYNGPGEYLFKVGRYTPSCSSPSVWSAETTIAITGPTPTPTPTPIPTSTAVPTSTPTPTSKPTATLMPKPSVSPTPIKSLTPTKESQKDENLSSMVLGSSDQNDTSTKNEQQKQVKIKAINANNLVGNFFIILGIIFTALCGIVFFWPHRHKLIEKFRK